MTAPDNPSGQPDRSPAHGWQPDHPGWQPDAGWQPTPGHQPKHAAPVAEHLPLVTPPPATRSRRGRMLIASAAAVVVAGGGVGTYVAARSASAPDGPTSARQAVQRLITDLGHSDLIGVLNDLPPNERTAIAGPFADTVKQLQRNGVVRQDADLHKVGGVSFAAEHLTYATTTDPIGAHVQVVQITGGTLRVSADVANLPLTAAFFKAAAPGGQAPHGTSTKSVDIASAVRASGKPLRIAVQQVGDGWYPSLFYTVADAAATDHGLPAPTAAQRVPAMGESSADAAVSTMLRSLLKGDVRRAIELVSPDELPVLHDYGTVVAANAHYPAAPVTIKNIHFRDTSVTGGTSVGIESLEVSAQGMDVTVSLFGSCPTVTTEGHSQRLCPDQLLGQFGGLGIRLTAAQERAFTHLFAGLTDQGFHTSRIDGKWYLDPVQSYAEELPRLLSHLQGDDLLQLIALADEN